MLEVTVPLKVNQAVVLVSIVSVLDIVILLFQAIDILLPIPLVEVAGYVIANSLISPPIFATLAPEVVSCVLIVECEL